MELSKTQTQRDYRLADRPIAETKQLIARQYWSSPINSLRLRNRCSKLWKRVWIF